LHPHNPTGEIEAQKNLMRKNVPLETPATSGVKVENCVSRNEFGRKAWCMEGLEFVL